MRFSIHKLAVTGVRNPTSLLARSFAPAQGITAQIAKDFVKLIARRMVGKNDDLQKYKPRSGILVYQFLKETIPISVAPLSILNLYMSSGICRHRPYKGSSIFINRDINIILFRCVRAHIKTYRCSAKSAL